MRVVPMVVAEHSRDLVQAKALERRDGEHRVSGELVHHKEHLADRSFITKLEVLAEVRELVHQLSNAWCELFIAHLGHASGSSSVVVLTRSQLDIDERCTRVVDSSDDLLSFGMPWNTLTTLIADDRSTGVLPVGTGVHGDRVRKAFLNVLDHLREVCELQRAVGGQDVRVPQEINRVHENGVVRQVLKEPADYRRIHIRQVLLTSRLGLVDRRNEVLLRQYSLTVCLKEVTSALEHIVRSVLVREQPRLIPREEEVTQRANRTKVDLVNKARVCTSAYDLTGDSCSLLVHRKSVPRSLDKLIRWFCNLGLNDGRDVLGNRSQLLCRLGSILRKRCRLSDRSQLYRVQRVHWNDLRLRLRLRLRLLVPTVPTTVRLLLSLLSRLPHRANKSPVRHDGLYWYRSLSVGLKGKTYSIFKCENCLIAI